MVSTYTDIISLEGSGICPGPDIEGNYMLGQRLSYEEYRSVHGEVSLFEYVVGFESGLLR